MFLFIHYVQPACGCGVNRSAVCAYNAECRLEARVGHTTMPTGGYVSMVLNINMVCIYIVQHPHNNKWVTPMAVTYARVGECPASSNSCHLTRTQRRAQPSSNHTEYRQTAREHEASKRRVEWCTLGPFSPFNGISNITRDVHSNDQFYRRAVVVEHVGRIWQDGQDRRAGTRGLWRVYEF